MLVLEELNRNNIDSFARFMETESGNGCYCAVWKHHDDTWEDRCMGSDRPNLQLVVETVRRGEPMGFLCKIGEELIGWVGTGPITRFPYLKEKNASRLTRFHDDTWAIVCITVARRHRNRGLSSQIIQCAVDVARSKHARCVEAYPLMTFDAQRGYRGSYRSFLQLGFECVLKDGEGGNQVALLRRVLAGST